jgi:predicted nuclease of restriction endonuclease-like (RecB) superfamily
MAKKTEIGITENDYKSFLSGLVELIESAKLETNNAINASINKFFAEKCVNLKVSGDISTNPLALKILGLKDDFSGKSVKEVILQKIEEFLVNFEMKFTVVYRNKKFKLGEISHQVDLVLFHRRLKCLVIIDLKLGKFSHADVGQMILYTNYANEHWCEEGENPPIGLILCAQKSDALAHYTLENLPNKILASEYKMILPDENVLEAEIIKAKRLIGK